MGCSNYKSMPCLLNSQKRSTLKKDFKHFTDDMFKVCVAHSRVIGSNCFFNTPMSMSLFLVPICFKLQICSANDNFMLHWSFFSD